jgi:capsular polysaccharide biosynthesis protein
MTSDFTQDDELSLRHLYLVLKRYSRSLLITPIVLALGAFLVSSFLISPKYEASATIQIGQVNKIILQSAPTYLARIRNQSFVSDVIDAHKSVFMSGSNDPLVLVAERAKLKSSLEAKSLKGIDVVTLTLTSSSREGALTKVSAVLATLQDEHTVLFQSGVDSIKRQINSIDREIDKLKAGMNIRHPMNVQEQNIYDAALDGFKRQDNNNQIFILTQNKFHHEASLNPLITFNTKLLGSVSVSDRPVSPNVPLITFIALLFGFFLAVVMIFVRNELGKPPF